MAKRRYETADCSNYEILKRFSRENRNKSTDAESALWNILRRNNLGVHFRRQHIILGYIADFVCLSHSLIIEIDGGYHSTSEQQMDDEERTRYLSTLGFSVLRFTNEQVLSDTDNVIKIIKKRITASPQLSPEERGLS